MAGHLGRARRGIARSPMLQVMVFIVVLFVVLLASEYLGLIPG